MGAHEDNLSRSTGVSSTDFNRRGASLHLDEPSLERDPARRREPPETAVRAHYAVTRNHERDGVGGQRPGDRARVARIRDPFREPAVTAGPAVGNCSTRPVDLPLKPRDP